MLHGARVSVLVVFHSSGTVFTMQNFRVNAYPLYPFILSFSSKFSSFFPSYSRFNGCRHTFVLPWM